MCFSAHSGPIERNNNLLVQFQEVTVDEAVGLQALRDGDWTGVLESLSGAQDAVGQLMARQLEREMREYASRPSSVLRDVDVDSLVNFSLTRLRVDLEEHLPTAWLLAKSMCTRDKPGKLKTAESITPAITVAVAKMAAIYSNKLSAMRYVTGISLASGGAKDTCVNRFASSYDSVKQATLLRKLDDLAKHGLEPLDRWKQEGRTFSIVFDNVNKHVKPRHQTATRGNEMHNLTHGIAILDRIPTARLPSTPRIPIANLTVADCLPSWTHDGLIRTKMAGVVRRVWGRLLPNHTWLWTDIGDHKYSDYSSAQTDKVR